PAIHIKMNKDLRQAFIDGYSKDKQLGTPYLEATKAEDSKSAGKRFYRDSDGLLFFINVDFQPRLCVPKSLQQFILTESHESPWETAH
ncbi:hypothetical protein ARMSODRAFT_839291, partial [Armillaria solidipes]